MTTIPYTDLLAGIEALCGASLAAVEQTRIKAFVNRRARKAYAESRYWPRFLKVEERVVSEDGLLPYEEDGLSTIGQVFRIHADQPYERDTSLEYVDFSARADGIQITNYQPREASAGANMVISGTLNPDITGVYTVIGETESRGGTTWPTYQSTSNSNYYIYGQAGDSGGVDNVSWLLGDYLGLDYWTQDFPSPDYITPDLANNAYIAIGSATGTPTVTAQTVYSAFVTYKAKLTSTYGDGESDDSDVPEEWFDYLLNGAYSDWLRNEGQNEKAIVEDQLATEFLTQQLEKLDAQSGSYVFANNLTHANTQTR